MTRAIKEAINSSKTMLVLIRAMQEDGEVITFRNSRINSIKDCVAQIRTENMSFNWIVTTRGRIIHEDHSVLDDVAKRLISEVAA